MRVKKIIALSLSAMMIAATAAGCGPNQATTQSSTAPQNTTSKGEKELSGKITVLTNRTDIVDTQFKGYYGGEFKKKYPNVEVEFEAITNYEDDVKTRMSTEEYGDVLLMPAVKPEEYPNFFEPLGEVNELKNTYNYIDSKGSFQGKVYGIATFGVVSGVVYNRKVFKDAGIEKLPSTPDEFIAAMQKIKDKFGEKCIPCYTNYACGWALNQWEDHKISVTGDADYGWKIAHDEAPFAKGKPEHTVYKLMYDLVEKKLVEKDPTTSDWETSRKMLANGEIGTMMLGSWSIAQVKNFAENKDDIGYMPFPYNVNGKVYAPAGPDYLISVNKNSKNKEAALAFLHWFIDEAKYYDFCQCISPLKADGLPDSLKSFEDMGVIFVVNNAAPEGEEGLTDKVAKQAEIGLYDDPWKKPIIERALSGKSFDEYMESLNKKWKAAKDELGVKNLE